MTVELSRCARRVQEVLAGLGRDFEVVELPSTTRTAAEAAKAIGCSVELIAYTKREKAALLAIIQGQTFTAGWHVVIKRERGRWQLVSDNNVWVH